MSSLSPVPGSLSPAASSSSSSDEHWDLVIKPQTGLFDFHLADVWRYRDLLWLFVWRDFVSVYKQTILGPLWFVIQPVLSTLMYTVVFSGLAKISTDGLPPMLFYFAGITPWNYFTGCLNKTAYTFMANAGIFGKVYFPRLISPLSVVISSLVQFLIQFGMFLAFLAWYGFKGAPVKPDYGMILLLTPVLLAIMGLLGLGLGIIISSLTTKYRDFANLIGFGLQLAMYATPVIYPLSAVPDKYKGWLQLNPMTSVIETFRAIYLGGTIPWSGLGMSAAITTVCLFIGILLFNKVEKTFMDTV